MEVFVELKRGNELIFKSKGFDSLEKVDGLLK